MTPSPVPLTALVTRKQRRDEPTEKHTQPDLEDARKPPLTDVASESQRKRNNK